MGIVFSLFVIAYVLRDANETFRAIATTKMQYCDSKPAACPWFERAHCFSPQKPSEAFLISKVSRLPIIMCVPGTTTKLPREGKRTSQEGFTLSYVFLAVSCRNQVRFPCRNCHKVLGFGHFPHGGSTICLAPTRPPLKKKAHDAPCCPSDDHIHCIPLSGEQGERQAKKTAHCHCCKHPSSFDAATATTKSYQQHDNIPDNPHHSLPSGRSSPLCAALRERPHSCKATTPTHGRKTYLLSSEALNGQTINMQHLPRTVDPLMLAALV